MFTEDEVPQASDQFSAALNRLLHGDAGLAGGLVASLRYDDHEPVRWLGAGGTSAGP